MRVAARVRSLLPSAGREVPLPESAPRYFEHSPEEWQKERDRGREKWDLVLDGELSEDEAFARLEEFLARHLRKKGHKMYAGTKVKKARPAWQ